MNILSIQSQVVYGHVGNRSAVFPLERMGHEVWPLETVQFSYNTGIPGCAGYKVDGEQIKLILNSLESYGVFSKCDAILSGYFGEAETIKNVITSIDRIKQLKPSSIYCCDPVLGDYPKGLYVNEEVKELQCNELIRRADIVTPNVFEAETLSGIKIIDRQSASCASKAILDKGPKIVIITSYTSNNETGFFMNDGKNCYEIMTPILPFKEAPHGCGDMSSALFLGYYLKKHDTLFAIRKTASALFSILEASFNSNSDTLSIVEAQDSIVSSEVRFGLKRI